jgi:hypothetical protein
MLFWKNNVRPRWTLEAAAIVCAEIIVSKSGSRGYIFVGGMLSEHSRRVFWELGHPPGG